METEREAICLNASELYPALLTSQTYYPVKFFTTLTAEVAKEPFEETCSSIHNTVLVPRFTWMRIKVYLK